MSYIGSWKLGDLVTFYANTHNPSNGSAVDADAVPNYHVYEDETATPLITGTMALLNGANTVGFYSEQISISGSLGFEKGKSYGVYIQAVVNNVTGTMHHYFQVEAEVDANTVSTPVTAGNVTGSVLGNVNGSVNSVTQPVGINTGTFLEALADKVWDELLSGHLTPDSAGYILFSRMPTGTVLVGDKTGFSLASPQNFNLIGNITGTFVGNINGAVQSVTNPVTVGTNNDKTGYSLSSPQTIDINGTITNVTNVINPVVAGVVTGSVLGNVNGSVNSVTQPVGINTGTFLDALADKVWDEPIAGHLAAGSVGNALNAAGSAGDPWSTVLPGSYTASQAGGILASRMPTGTVLVGDKTGFSLSTPQNFDNLGTQTNVTNVVNPVTAGNVTGSVLGNVNGSVGSVVGNVGGSVGSVTSPVTAGNVTGSVLGNVNGSVGSVTSPVGINTGTFFDALADEVWDEQLAGHLSAGSAGSALNGAGAAGDPWQTALPGAYTAGQAGHILASRMPTGTVIVGTNQDKTGYSLASPQSVNIIGNISGTFVGNIQGQLTDISSTLGNKIADFILRRPLASARSSSDGDAVTFRSLLGALSKLVNRWKIQGTTLTVYQEDDTTAAGTQALTGTAGADPITEIDTS